MASSPSVLALSSDPTSGAAAQAWSTPVMRLMASENSRQVLRGDARTPHMTSARRERLSVNIAPVRAVLFCDGP